LTGVLRKCQSLDKEIRDYYKFDAKSYEKRRFRKGGLLVHRAEMEILFRLLKPRSTDLFLDIGAGTGRFERMIETSKCSVVACDVTREMLKIAAKYTSASFVQSDCFKLPFKSGTFDRCVALRFLFHFDDIGKIQILKEVLRVTKKKGLIVFDLQNSRSLFALLIPIKNRNLNLPSDPRELKSLFSELPSISCRFHFSFFIPRGVYRHLPKKISQMLLFLEELLPYKIKKTFSSTIFCLVRS
jgi:ubiquinone/menaquinone biosynthesis C-methylase UbiE